MTRLFLNTFTHAADEKRIDGAKKGREYNIIALG